MNKILVISFLLNAYMGFPGGSEVKASASNGGGPGFNPWVGKIPWRRKWQSTPVFLPGESHGRKSLVGYSPRGRKESDTTEQLHLHLQWQIGYWEWEKGVHQGDSLIWEGPSTEMERKNKSRVEEGIVWFWTGGTYKLFSVNSRRQSPAGRQDWRYRVW